MQGVCGTKLFLAVQGDMRVLLIDTSQVAQILRIVLKRGLHNILLRQDVIDVPVVGLMLFSALGQRLAACPQDRVKRWRRLRTHNFK